MFGCRVSGSGWVSVALAAAAFRVTGCGSDDPGANTSATADTFNDADVTFLQSMIPHHQQAIEMAELPLDPKRTAGAEVAALAKRVQAAQDPEIAQMEQWLTSWGKPTEMDMSDGHDMSSMDGMMSDDDMKTLGAATGSAFDELWLKMMVEHHEGAVDMAEGVKAEGKDREIAKLADQIIAAQQAEIAEMNALLA